MNSGMMNVEQLTQAVEAGSTPDAVDVILTDVEQSDWAQGGELFSENIQKRSSSIHRPAKLAIDTRHLDACECGGFK
jgi:hypothetical protein